MPRYGRSWYCTVCRKQFFPRWRSESDETGVHGGGLYFCSPECLALWEKHEAARERYRRTGELNPEFTAS